MTSSTPPPSGSLQLHLTRSSEHRLFTAAALAELLHGGDACGHDSCANESMPTAEQLAKQEIMQAAAAAAAAAASQQYDQQWDQPSQESAEYAEDEQRGGVEVTDEEEEDGEYM